jgi:hypothetical protein
MRAGRVLANPTWKKMMKLMKRFCLFPIALAASFTAMTGAHARDARVHAFACKTFGGVPIDFNFSLQNDSSTEYMTVYRARMNAGYARRSGGFTLPTDSSLLRTVVSALAERQQ